MTTATQPPKLRFHEIEILLGAFALLELLGSGSAMGHSDKLELEAVGIPWKPRDLANTRRLARSQSKAFSAARESLENLGLVVSLQAGWSEARTTHIRPTEKALNLATELTLGQADLASIAAGLRRTEWGPELARHTERLASTAPASPPTN